VLEPEIEDVVARLYAQAAAAAGGGASDGPGTGVRS
jgi:hypothetical protein